MFDSSISSDERQNGTQHIRPFRNIIRREGESLKKTATDFPEIRQRMISKYSTAKAKKSGTRFPRSSEATWATRAQGNAVEYAWQIPKVTQEATGFERSQGEVLIRATCA